MGRSAETADTYFGEITFRGTNTGDLTMPDGTSIPATGKPVEVRGVEFARVRDGKLIEHNMYWDSLVMMRQLGFAPPASLLCAPPSTLRERVQLAPRGVVHTLDKTLPGRQ